MDWKAFLDEHAIEYRDRGANVTKGNIVISCPWCGDDPSMHLSISLEGKGYHCWRDTEHQGRSEAKLIVELLHCSWREASRYVGDVQRLPSDLLSVVESLTAEPFGRVARLANKLSMPPEFREFKEQVSSWPYTAYLSSRGVHDFEARRWGLRYCTHGDFQGRIIFPIEHE